MSAAPCQPCLSNAASNRAATFSSSALISNLKKLFRASASSRAVSLISTENAENEKEETGKNSTITSGPLTDQDVDEVVFYLLEKLNDYSEELNQLSIIKESVEKQLKGYHRCLQKQMSHIEQTYGKRSLALLEIYFEKMLRLCMRDLELQHCYEMQSDMEDELNIAGSTIEHFDTQDLEICLQQVNISHDCNSELMEQPPSLMVLHSFSNSESSISTLTNEANLEIVQKMRTKMQNICKQIGSLHDKISNIQSRMEVERTSFEKFCKLKHTELQQMSSQFSNFFDTRMSSMMLMPKLERFSTKIDRTRRSYAATMNDLHLVSMYIREFSNKQDEQQQLNENNDVS